MFLDLVCRLINPGPFVPCNRSSLIHIMATSEAKSMEDFDKLDNTGDLNDLDYSDQLPVKAPKGPDNSFCYICNSSFRHRKCHGFWKPESGVYSVEAILAKTKEESGAQIPWDCLYRVSMYFLLFFSFPLSRPAC